MRWASRVLLSMCVPLLLLVSMIKLKPVWLGSPGSAGWELSSAFRDYMNDHPETGDDAWSES